MPIPMKKEQSRREPNGNDEDDESETVSNNDVPIEQSEGSSSDNIQINDETE